MKRYKFQLFDKNNDLILEFEGAEAYPISLHSDYKGDTVITWGVTTKRINEWIEFFKAHKDGD